MKIKLHELNGDLKNKLQYSIVHVCTVWNNEVSATRQTKICTLYAVILTYSKYCMFFSDEWKRQQK